LELVKDRKQLTEAETKYYLVQLLAAVQYLHSRHVIHRDLKLGNLFLNKNLQIKIGDFGLATVVEFEGERKKYSLIFFSFYLMVLMRAFLKKKKNHLRDTKLHCTRNS